LEKEEVLRYVEELSKRHNVPMPKVKFLPPPSITAKIMKDREFVFRKTVATELICKPPDYKPKTGGKITIIERCQGSFMVNEKTGECWIEFYGKPTKTVVNHEFKHYLEHLGVKYKRKKPERGR